MAHPITRRLFLGTLAAAPLAGAGGKPLRGIFPIMATPFTESNAVDYEDLAREVGFLERCGVHGMVWPQLASEYVTLSREERLRGMKVLAEASRGKKGALVLGVQGANIKAAMDYLELAEQLEPDALIAIPPTEAASVEDFRRYYATLAAAARRPIFVQTTGGAKGVTPPVEMMVELAKEHPNLAYVKEEAAPVIERMKSLAKHRPTVKGIFSGAGGRGMLYEWRLGMDGTMPGSPYSDVYVAIWDAWHSGDRDKAREIFSRLLLMHNIEQQIPGTRLYIMKKRGVFKTMASRRTKPNFGPDEIAEMDYNFAALEPYLRA